jgi:hypothetical protein
MTIYLLTTIYGADYSPSNYGIWVGVVVKKLASHQCGPEFLKSLTQTSELGLLLIPYPSTFEGFAPSSQINM